MASSQVPKGRVRKGVPSTNAHTNQAGGTRSLAMRHRLNSATSQLHSKPYTKPFFDGKCTTRSYHGHGVFERFSSCFVYTRASRFFGLDHPFSACDLNPGPHFSATTHPSDKTKIPGTSPQSPLPTRQVKSMVFCGGYATRTSVFSLLLRGCCHGWTCTTADLIIPCGTRYHGSGLGMRTLHIAHPHS